MWGYLAAIVLPYVVFVGGTIAVHARRNRAALARWWADTHGCRHLASNQALVPHLSGEPFAGGGKAKVREFVSGTTPGGHTFCSFRYSFNVSKSRGSSTSMRGCVVMVRLPAALPALSLRYEEIGDKIGKFFGGQDIDLESEEFNQMFRVMSPDEAFASELLHPLMMRWLMGAKRVLVPFYINGQDLVCVRDGKPDYATLERQVVEMCDFVDQIPQGVFEKYAAPSAIGW